MNLSATGHFYGTTNQTTRLNGITLTDTEYSLDRVPWHFHENNYFTFILQGGVIEGNKKEIYECTTGTLLFHNWQDAHYNIASGQFTRGFHVELGAKWFESFDTINNVTEGSIRIADPRVKTLMYNILKEMKLGGDDTQLAIDALLLEIFGLLGKTRQAANSKKPKWVNRIKEMLHGSTHNCTLAQLANSLDVHPGHLSREFSRHFHTTLGEYIRSIKVQRALALLPNSDLSLTNISFECGFADQSHFIRAFRSYYHVTPLVYRKLLLKRA